jgi:NAD+ synthase
LPQEIIDAMPTDGLWDDGRTDEDQLGMSYPDLERAMVNDQLDRACVYETSEIPMSKEEKAQLRRYRDIRRRNLHKMEPIPVCKMPANTL